MKPRNSIITMLLLTTALAAGCTGCGYFADKKYEEVVKLIDSERYTEAVALATESIGRYPGDPRFYYERGYCLVKTDLPAAKKDFMAALKLDPKYSNAYYGLSILHRKEKQYDLAEANILKAIELAPDNERKAAFYSGLASLYGNRRDFAKAIEFCHKSLELDDRGETYYRLGIFYYNNSRKKEAVETWTRALKEKTFRQVEFEHLTWSELARYYLKTRDFVRAKESAGRARALAPDSKEYRELLDKIEARMK